MNIQIEYNHKNEIAQIKFICYAYDNIFVRTILTHIGVHWGNILMYTSSHEWIEKCCGDMGVYRWVYNEKNILKRKRNPHFDGTQFEARDIIVKCLSKS